MDRTNPWDAPPRTASWRRLATVVVPLVVSAACDESTPPGTLADSSTADTESSPGTSPPTDTSDTGTP